MNKYLKARIVERYGSQFEFARALGEHEAVVSRIIRGHRELTPKEQMKWANALGCDDPERLFRQ
jgi:plasmid maintenance system antidote protein VapI